MKMFDALSRGIKENKTIRDYERIKEKILFTREWMEFVSKFILELRRRRNIYKILLKRCNYLIRN